MSTVCTAASVTTDACLGLSIGVFYINCSALLMMIGSAVDVAVLRELVNSYMLAPYNTDCCHLSSVQTASISLWYDGIEPKIMPLFRL